jgi:hypothetical protein
VLNGFPLLRIEFAEVQPFQFKGRIERSWSPPARPSL